MSVNLSPFAGAGAQFFTDAGTPLTGGLLYSYAAGTTTPATTYTSSDGLTANSNPIVLDAAGRVPYEIWLTSGSSYKFVLKTSVGTTVGTWDNIDGINDVFLTTQFYADVFTTTAGQTTFTLSDNPGSVYNLTVSLDGAVLTATQDFTWTGTTLVLSMAAFADQTMRVAYSSVAGVKAISPGSVTTAGLVDGAVTNIKVSATAAIDSTKLSFLQSGTGAVTTNIQTVLRRTVHVNDFGADPTGVADSGAAIAAAIASLPTGGTAYGGIVQFGKGVYLSANTKITIPNGVWLKGEGAPATQIKAGNSFNQTALVTNAVQDGTQEYAYVSDLFLDGNKGGGAVCSNAVLDFVSLFVNSAILNVVITSGSAYGLRLHASNSGAGGSGPVLVDNSWVVSCDNHNIMLSADAASVNAATGYYLHRVTSEHQATGKSSVYIQGNGKLNLVSIRDLHIEQANTGASTQSITLDGATDVIVDGAQIQSASSASGGILITNQATNVRFRFQNITNINVITAILTDQKNSVTFGAVNLPFYAAPDFGIHQDRAQTLTYSAAINTDMALGNYCIIVVSNGTAFTLNSPTNAQIGETLTYEIVNASGGAMGTITWGANFSYRDTSWTNPANGKRRLIQFKYRQANSWAQCAPATGDM